MNSDGSYTSLELYFVSLRATERLSFGREVHAGYYCPLNEGDIIEVNVVRIGPLLSGAAQRINTYELYIDGGRSWG